MMFWINRISLLFICFALVACQNVRNEVTNQSDSKSAAKSVEATSLIQQISMLPPGVVTIRNIHDEYQRFEQIKPIVANTTGRDIYSPYIGAGLQLLRYDEVTSKWEKCGFGFMCGNVFPGIEKESRAPIVSGDEMVLSVNSERANILSYDSFIVHMRNFQIKRPLEGKYKLLFEYTYIPWSSYFVSPKKKFSVVSKEFRIPPR